MTDSTKKILIIVVVVLAVGGAIGSAVMASKGEEGTVRRVGSTPKPGQKFGKAAQMEREKSDSNPVAAGQ